MAATLARISSRGLVLILELEEAHAVDQLQHAGELLVGQVRLEVPLGCRIDPDVAAPGSVEPVRVVLAWDGCDEGVDDRRQRLPLQGGEFDGHGVTSQAWRVGDQARRGAGRLMPKARATRRTPEDATGSTVTATGMKSGDRTSRKTAMALK